MMSFSKINNTLYVAKGENFVAYLQYNEADNLTELVEKGWYQIVPATWTLEVRSFREVNGRNIAKFILYPKENDWWNTGDYYEGLGFHYDLLNLVRSCSFEKMLWQSLDGILARATQLLFDLGYE